jgi:Ribophorin I
MSCARLCGFSSRASTGSAQIRDLSAVACACDQPSDSAAPYAPDEAWQLLTAVPCRSATFKCKLATGHQLVADPPSITQDQEQLVAFESDVFVLSPYSVQAQTTNLRTGTLVSHTDVEGATSAVTVGKLVYTATGRAQPFLRGPVRVHYKNNSPFLQILELERDITVRSRTCEPQELWSAPCMHAPAEG